MTKLWNLDLYEAGILVHCEQVASDDLEDAIGHYSRLGFQTRLTPVSFPPGESIDLPTINPDRTCFNQ